MPNTSQLQRFIILPARGMQNSASPTGNPEVTDFLVRASSHQAGRLNVNAVRRSFDATKDKKPQLKIKVLDSIHEDGAKLVEMNVEDMSKLRLSQPGIRIIPEVFYDLQRIPRMQVSKKASTLARTAQVASGVTITIKDMNNNPLKGVTVVAFTDFEAREGAGGKTKTNGEISLTITKKTIERLYIYPDHSFWPYLYKAIKVTKNKINYVLDEVNPAYKDCLKHFFGTLSSLGNTVIKVGVIDTGVGPHNNLQLIGGACTVLNEPVQEFNDYDGHGTHVAGIIGGSAPMKGVAPGVQILSYRVFPKSGGGASNYDIMNAVDKAIADGCHLINMSLGSQGGYDEGLSSSIKDAYYKGVLCFVATGNDGRLPVSYPANHPLAIAVSAFGRKGTFPPKTEPNGSIKAPYGSDKKNFIADFSNIGKEVDLTGPGVGIVSCYPNDRYAVMSGTSMACPAVCGVMANLLTNNPQIANLGADQARTDAFISLLAKNTKSLGFSAKFEGSGMPR